MYVYIYICIERDIYIYIYIERERYLTDNEGGVPRLPQRHRVQLDPVG